MAEELVDRVRQAALARGTHGIKSLGRMFRIFDDNGNRKLDFEEFKYGLNDYGVKLTDDECRELFAHFDVNGDGAILFDELLKAIRGKIPACREALIKKAFQKADRTGDGIITHADLKGVYNVRQHPKYQSGELTEKEVFKQFLESFEGGTKDPDGKVTYEEFLNYYVGVSHSIDDNAYFDLMMRNAWKL